MKENQTTYTNNKTNEIIDKIKGRCSLTGTVYKILTADIIAVHNGINTFKLITSKDNCIIQSEEFNVCGVIKSTIIKGEIIPFGINIGYLKNKEQQDIREFNGYGEDFIGDEDYMILRHEATFRLLNKELKENCTLSGRSLNFLGGGYIIVTEEYKQGISKHIIDLKSNNGFGFKDLLRFTNKYENKQTKVIYNRIVNLAENKTELPPLQDVEEIISFSGCKDCLALICTKHKIYRVH